MFISYLYGATTGKGRLFTLEMRQQGKARAWKKKGEGPPPKVEKQSQVGGLSISFLLKTSIDEIIQFYHIHSTWSILKGASQKCT